MNEEMDELISKKALLQAITDIDDGYNMDIYTNEIREIIEELPTIPQTYEWCKGCKEYDQENHCCHRYSSFIRETLQDNINAVLEDIKAEWIIVGKTTFHYECSICGGAGDKWDKFCKHCGRKMTNAVAE